MLVAAIPVATCVEPKETADQKADRRLMGDHEHGRVRLIDHDPADQRQCPGEHVQPGLTAFGREGERVDFLRGVFLRKLRLDLRALQALPTSVVDLAETVDRAMYQGGPIRRTLNEWACLVNKLEIVDILSRLS